MTTGTQTRAALADELRREFADAVPGTVIHACLVQALADLRGSISPEALPEMAIRLARVRLGAMSAPHAIRYRSGPVTR